MKSLRELYNLSVDESGFNSGLVQWYNNVINKSVDELTIADISKMIRQNILADIAVKRAIEIFFLEPYDGEYQDGGLLSFLLTLDMTQIGKGKLNELNAFLRNVKADYTNFDWESKKAEEQYRKEIEEMETKISKLIST